ncbi:hypothetical protein B6U93_02920 [Candidatus Woesearchaeota archaeon ex4484_78]|nr:MAG: hypothetical protein B6U93_02920 [Candidatus Woesearchaeota archaeon ex4484_78]
MKTTAIFVLTVVVIVGMFALFSTFYTQGPLTILTIPGASPATDTLEVRNVYMGDYICKDTPVLTDYHLKGLNPSYIIGNYKTQAIQQVRNCIPGTFNGGQLIFNTDNRGVTSDFLYYNDYIFDYLLDFTGGLASKITDNELEEIKDKDLNILGSKCTILDAKTTGNQIELRLWCSSGRIDLTDNDYTDNKYQAFGAKINGQNAADVMIKATRTGDILTISTINYRVPAMAATGSEVYVAPGTCVSGYLKYPQSMLNEFDICYKGLGKASTRAGTTAAGNPNFEIKNIGSHGYKLYFINNRGNMVELPLADTTGGLHYGDRNNNLYFTEAPNPGAPNINQGDFFVVNGQDNSLRDAVSCVIKFSSIDTTNNVVQFVDSSTGSRSATYSPATNQGMLNICAGSFLFQVDPANARLAIDNNGDGQINGNTVWVALAGGVRMRPSGMSFDIITNRQLFEDRTTNEVTTFNIIATGNRIDLQVPSPQGNFELQYVGDNWNKGMTDYGILWEYYEKRPGRLRLTIPSRQLAAGVWAGGTLPGKGQAGGTIVFTTAKSKILEPAKERPAAKKSFCGGGSVEAGEECDPPGTFCLYEDPVTKATLKGKCGPDCKCIWPKPKCGNQVKENREQCEVAEHCGTGYECINCKCVKEEKKETKLAEKEQPVQIKPVCGNQILEQGEVCEYGYPCPQGYVCNACKCQEIPKQEPKGFFSKIIDWFKNLF